ncbi:MAG: type II toxin-antitoxin system PemK/MazF family toxin [Rhodanobacteraceae bacterium]|nr:MAG: type II toxin-antitoxin system PemK/MazF family toxin [Rhodanobacteraceae bacterium]
MKRGDLITVALQGDFGKPRPALVVQADAYGAHTSVTVLPVTSTRIDAPLLRVALAPSADNGLTRPSQVMIDKTMTVRQERLGEVIGHVTPDELLEIDRCLAVFLGIAR